MLDLGCGTGFFIECCQKHGIKCLGIERSDIGKKICRGKEFEVIQYDLRLPYVFLEDESFDAIFCFQVIEHLTPSAQLNLLRESYRVLKKGGEIQIDSPCKYYYEQVSPAHISLLTPKELYNLAKGVGFININLIFNYPQYPPDIPKEVVDDLWNKYHPDILA